MVHKAKPLNFMKLKMQNYDELKSELEKEKIINKIIMSLTQYYQLAKNKLFPICEVLQVMDLGKL